jgi:hypothetical protein
MNLKLFAFIIFSLAILTNTQQCRNKQGWRVDWWVMLAFPDSVSTGFAFFDSRSASPALTVYTD